MRVEFTFHGPGYGAAWRDRLGRTPDLRRNAHSGERPETPPGDGEPSLGGAR